MQMAKTSAAPKRPRDGGGSLYSDIDPTTGGVTAKFCYALRYHSCRTGSSIGFAGPRDEQTIGQKLPEGFQRQNFFLSMDLLIRSQTG